MRVQDLGLPQQANQNQTDPSRKYRGWPKAHDSTVGKPFPWIKWNNRPFTGVHELLEVPASTPARLCFEFGYCNPTPADPNVTPPTMDSYDARPNTQQRREFRHLLNFFHSRNDDPVPAVEGESADVYNILDYLHVPSRFAGTETVLNPAVYSQSTPLNVAAATMFFRPPYNLISNYRDPGRINLNTINDANVWKAVAPHRWDAMTSQWVPEVTWQEFNVSRRGDTKQDPLAPVGDPQNSRELLPTIMANPFRSGAAADLVPQGEGTPLEGSLRDLKHRGVSVTILRSKGDSPDDDRDPADPASPAKVPLFATTTSDTDPADPLYRNNSRNSAFRYQNIERLSNIVTTRSNVYAVWVTVGYFEAFPNPGGIDAGHPDGYQIGAELGSDTGDVTRHRGFYIFDRSIPVGFERGANHNIDRAILLKRFIE